MKNQFSALIKSLEVINLVPKRVLSILKAIEKNNRADDSLVASCIIALLATQPEIMKHSRNQALRQLCRELHPTNLYLSPFIRSQFFDEPPIPTPQSEFKRKK